MSEVPLCSSNEIINALRRAGFKPARRAKGDHQVYVRERSDGRKDITLVHLGQREVARYTLRNIIQRAGMTVEEFCGYLK